MAYFNLFKIYRQNSTSRSIKERFIVKGNWQLLYLSILRHIIEHAASAIHIKTHKWQFPRYLSTSTLVMYIV